jgi:hypothetical protein
MAQDFRAQQIQTSQIISSGSSTTGAKIVFYDVSGQSAVSPNQGIIDPALFNTSSIGSDIFVYVSGGIGKKNVGNSNAIACFGGDVHVSGNLTVDGVGTTNTFRVTVVDYATTTNTSSNPEVVGQAIFDGSDFSGSLTLRAILNSAGTGSIAVAQLYELTVGSYVDISGPGVTEIPVTGATPTCIESVNLYTAAGFLTSSQGKYELRLHTATSGVAAFAGGVELKPSGTFTNLTIITQSFATQFVSGTTGFRLGFNDFASSSNTSSNPTAVGQVLFPAQEFASGTLTFRAAASVSTGSATGTIKLYNVSSGAYVEIGGTGDETLETNSTASVVLQSVNLMGATNFDTSSLAIYEMQIYSSTGSAIVFAGGGELRPSGSFTGVTNTVNRFVSGNTAFRLAVSDFLTTPKTSSNPAVAGQVIFPGNEYIWCVC